MNESPTHADTSGFLEIDLQEGLPPPAHIDLQRPDGSPKSLEEIEKEVILRQIEVSRGNMSEVARSLQIGRSTLYRKLAMWGLTPSLLPAEE